MTTRGVHDDHPVPDTDPAPYQAPQPVPCVCPLCGTETELFTDGTLCGHRPPDTYAYARWKRSCEVGGWSPEDARAILRERAGQPNAYIRPHP